MIPLTLNLIPTALKLPVKNMVIAKHSSPFDPPSVAAFFKLLPAGFTSEGGSKGFASMTYSEKLRDPRWQKLKAEVMQAAGFTCDDCGKDSVQLGIERSQFHVHHKFYIKGREPWEYDLTDLKCLCDCCHRETEDAIITLRQVFGDFAWYDINSICADITNAKRLGIAPRTLVGSIRLLVENPALAMGAVF